MSIWFCGDGRMLPQHEENIVNDAFIDNLAKFIKGERMQDWEGLQANEARHLKTDGKIETWKDDQWEEGLKVWDAIMDAPTPTTITEKEKPKL